MFLGILLFLLCFYNSFIIFRQIVNLRIPASNLTRQTLEQNRGKKIDIQLVNQNYTGTLFNLRDFDIKYNIKEKLPDSTSLYSDKILYFKRK